MNVLIIILAINVIINTTGGSLIAAEIIINAFKHHNGRIRVHIPHYALSAGMLIALAGDEIFLGENGFVGAVDPQLFGYFSASSIIKYAETYGEHATGWIGDLVKLGRGQAHAANNRIMSLLEGMLSEKYSLDEMVKIKEELASGLYNHDNPLFYEKLALWSYT